MATSPTSSRSGLMKQFKGSKYDTGFYLFKQAGGGQNHYHITKESSDESMCGHHSIGAIDKRDRFTPKELDQGMSISEVDELSGLGRGVCKNCQYKWENL